MCKLVEDLKYKRTMRVVADQWRSMSVARWKIGMCECMYKAGKEGKGSLQHKYDTRDTYGEYAQYAKMVKNGEHDGNLQPRADDK